MFLAPYRPLLDRQMFFAARSLPSQNPWLASFVYRLLNNQKEVLLLLNTDQNPFTKEPPKFVKVSLYKYQFSSKIQRYISCTTEAVANFYFNLYKYEEALMFLNVLLIYVTVQF